MPKLSKYWQAEMLGIDLRKLEGERFEEKVRPPMASSWALEFERLEYERRMDLARKIAQLKESPRP